MLIKSTSVFLIQISNFGTLYAFIIGIVLFGANYDRGNEHDPKS